jgi:glucose/arabinose dehydrogenase
MRGRTAALIAATAVSTGAVATSAMAASGPPPPPKATNGHTVQLVASGLHTPTSFAFGAGQVFEGDGGVESKNAPPNGGVFVLKNGTATELPGSPGFVAGLAWHDGALYISGGSLTPTGPKWQLWKWSGWNGTTFATQKAIYTAPKKFQGFNGIAFGADGRLYVGVDTGLLNNNDHGPSSTSPFVYDILSFKSNGTGRQVFATGIRQPWQMAFPKGSSSPFVSDLGQDSGAKNPPDFILRVHKGDNFGFPGCNWTSGSNCTGFAKPFQQFGPHTDLMGMVISGKRLYMTSFLGIGAKGTGEVLTMPLSGGKLTPLVKGFLGPTVGLGGNGGWLYVGQVGDATHPGLVYRVKL